MTLIFNWPLAVFGSVIALCIAGLGIARIWRP